MLTQTQRTNHQTGLIPGAAELAINVAERSQTTAIGLIQDARTEIRVVVDAGLELAEKSVASLFRFARKLTQRIDDATAETVAGVERLAGSSVRGARETTRATSDLVATTLDGMTGARPSA